MEKIRIAVLVGSARKDSFSRKIAQSIVERMPAKFEMQEIKIGQLPLFNQDYDDEGKTPAKWVVFREEIRRVQGYLFVTPEYNRSVPPVLKNALDVASRPYGQNAWNGKPGAVVSVSPGKPGGFGANHHLRQTLSFLNVYTMQQPELYIGSVTELLDKEGKISSEETGKFIQAAADAFAAWVERFVTA